MVAIPFFLRLQLRAEVEEGSTFPTTQKTVEVEVAVQEMVMRVEQEYLVKVLREGQHILLAGQRQGEVVVPQKLAQRACLVRQK
jgi:hypothetical protein